MDIDLEDGEWQHTSTSKENQKLEGGPPHFDEGGKHSRARRSLILDVHPQGSEDQQEPNELQLAEVSYRSPPAEGYAEFQTPVKEYTGTKSAYDSGRLLSNDSLAPFSA